MNVLDTNVISELMRSTPDRRVLAWVAARPAALLYTTTLTQAEILLGIALLPKGRRREAIRTAAELIFEEDFSSRLLPFDTAAAVEYAGIVSARTRRGRPIHTVDGQIAAICRAHGATLVTRNTSDFAECEIAVVNPWRSS